MTATILSREKPVLTVDGLRTYFFTAKGVVKAVNDISFTLQRGEILGLVGESGSGKSVTGYSLMGLVDPPGKIVSGSIRLNGTELVGMGEKVLRTWRGSRIAMVFQNSIMMLDPLMPIAGQMTEAILVHEKTSRRQALARARAALVKVGISSPDERLRAYPHELSGGMCQRVAIAIALLNKPDVIIADEPTTALDVTVQGQILAEVQHLVQQDNIAMIWITHDLSVVACLAHRIAVMYAGRVVEEGTTDEVLDTPRHPYTQGLIDSLPGQNARGTFLKQIPGMTPSLLALDDGCAFRKRCSRATAKCVSPVPVNTSLSGHMVACWYPLGVSDLKGADNGYS